MGAFSDLMRTIDFGGVTIAGLRYWRDQEEPLKNGCGDDAYQTLLSEPDQRKGDSSDGGSFDVLPGGEVDRLHRHRPPCQENRPPCQARNEQGCRNVLQRSLYNNGG